ncbi:MAG: hypothetical protein KJ000_34370 [Pirellulaceae bacterium]|nr:hypothetical protein [Pirellulaceae bacterium]
MTGSTDAGKSLSDLRQLWNGSPGILAGATGETIAAATGKETVSPVGTGGASDASTLPAEDLDHLDRPDIGAVRLAGALWLRLATLDEEAGAEPIGLDPDGLRDCGRFKRYRPAEVGKCRRCR